MKQLIAVVMGGPSREHEVSVQSGEAVLAGLDPARYDTIKVFITKTGEWSIDGQSDSKDQILSTLQSRNAAAFLALHGTYGEDGTLQAELSQLGIPFTGSGSAASALAMDKIKANAAYTRQHLTIPTTLQFVAADQHIAETIQEHLALPVIVKPVHEGSSIGISVVRTIDELAPAIKTCFDYEDTIMVQEYIRGTEVSCGVLEKDGQLTALPPTEIIPKVADFFSYDAKYTDGGSEEITPARLDSDLMSQVQQAAVTAHQALDCRTYSRTDMIIHEKTVYIIETNTLPGLTRHSLLPQQAKAAGMSFTELLDTIIAGARV